MQPTPPNNPQDEEYIQEKRKRVISISAIAFIILLVVVYLVSLATDEEEKVEPAVQQGEVLQPPPGPPRPRGPHEMSNDYQAGPDNAALLEDEDPFAGMKEAPPPPAEMGPPPAAVQAPGAVLYCDSFPSQAKAEEQKARIAFAGVSADVTRQDGRIVLRIGPFANRDQARAKFNQLAEMKLLGQCALVDE